MSYHTHISYSVKSGEAIGETSETKLSILTKAGQIVQRLVSEPDISNISSIA